MTIRPGGVDGQTEIDQGLLKASTTPGSDVLSLDSEFTVTQGRLVRRKFWQPRSRAARSTRRRLDRLEHLQAHLPRHDRQRGLDPDDNSEEAKAKRAAARSRRPRRHHLRRQDHGRAEHRSPLPGQEQARPAGAAQREGVARGHERRGRGAEPLAAAFGRQRLHAPRRPAWGQQPAKPAQQAAAAWQRPRAVAQDAGGGQPAKPAGPAWLNQ